jgi:hypothetical protein
MNNVTQIPKEGERYVHVKTGSEYVVVCTAYSEEDQRLLVVYRGPSSTTWVRPADEFCDGRFQLVR